MEAAAQSGDQRQEFYRKIAGSHLTPLWESLHALVPKTPNTQCAPGFWKFDEVRPFIHEAGRLITAEEAERRVLILENPAYPGESRITNTLYGGLQYILPGEVAPAHRHSQSALRFVMEGQGAFTAVDGEKTTMHPGDFILTPSWTWHDHGCEVDEPTIWYDGLDIPLVAYFGAGFAEAANVKSHEVSRPEGDAPARYGANLLPVDYEQRGKTSPIFNYPYARSREALEKLKTGPVDPHRGIWMKYINPATGDYALPTISAFLTLLPDGLATQRYRSTDATVVIVTEGTGESRIGDIVYRWGPRDIFVVPGWQWVTHHPDGEAVLFSYSDRTIQEKIGLWREERG